MLVNAAKIAWDGVIPIPPDPIPPGSNAYFEYLVARSDFWKGLSLRPTLGAPITSPYYAKQLDRPAQGGYLTSNTAPLWITYDAGVDAAKVVIPAFADRGTLLLSMSASDLKFYPNVTTFSPFVVNAQVKIDSEVMLITGVDPNTTSPRGVSVTRAQYGTSAASHSAGTLVQSSNNSLGNQLRFPLGTTDGNNYWFTWDVLFTNSYLHTGLEGNKTFQFASGPSDRIWLEVKIDMSGGNAATTPPGFDPLTDLGGFNARSYNESIGPANWLDSNGNQAGPGVTSRNPILPMVNTFQYYPVTWTRYWVNINQRANDYDILNMWIADETQEAVQVFSNILISVPTPANTIQKWWIEFNDSAARLPLGRTTDFRDLVAYVRNFASLQNPSSPPPFTKPE